MVEAALTRAGPGGPPTERARVSVLIPAHDAEKHLAASIESAIAQTYRPLEIIVVNDGSTDSTADVARNFGGRVVYVEQPNRGPAAARNAGLHAATGTLIALLDSDDLWMPERVDRCVEILERRPEIGFVTSDAYLIEDGIKTAKRCYGDRRRYPFPTDEDRQLEEIARRNFLFVGVVFHRSLVERCRGFDERIWGAEDYDLWTRFLLSGARAAFVNEPLGWYRRDPNSLSASPRQWTEHLFVLEKHLPYLWRHGVRGRARDAYEIGQHLVAKGDRRAAASFFWHAFLGEEVSTTTRVKLAGGALRMLVRSAPSRTGYDRPAQARRQPGG